MEFAKTTGMPQYTRLEKRKINGRNVILDLRIDDIIRCEVRGVQTHYAITTIGRSTCGVVVLDVLDDGENKLFVIKIDPTTGKNYVDPTTYNNLQYGRAIYRVQNVRYPPSNWIWVINESERLNLVASSKYQLYGICSNDNTIHPFMTFVKKGDRIWFTGIDGKLISVVSFVSTNNRSPGELIDITLTTKELGWINADNLDTELHYNHLYDMRSCDIYMRVHNGLRLFKHNNTTDAPGKILNEYAFICKYRDSSAELSIEPEQNENMIDL